MKTSKAQRKFELYRRLAELGFTFEESQQLRRIEMTLSRWGEAECNGEIERNETTGKPERNSPAWVNGTDDRRVCWPVADREAGALKRCALIVEKRNARVCYGDLHRVPEKWVYFYHQSDPRGCSLYIVKASDLPDSTDEQMRKHSGEQPLKDAETRLRWKLSCYYTRGLAVCS